MKKVLTKIFPTLILLTASFLFPSVAKAAWIYTLASTNPAYPAGNYCPGTNRDTIYKFTIQLNAGSGGANTLNTVTFTTNAGYAAASVTTFELYRSNANSAAPVAGAIASVAAAGPGPQTLTLTTPLNMGIVANSVWTFW